MNHETLRRRTAWAVLITLAALAATAGCAKRITSVDAGYTALEGTRDANAILLAWPDTPDTVEVWADLGTPGPDPDPDVTEDTLFARVPNYRTAPGVIHTVVLDRTAASGYQFFRRANNGGLQAMTDYSVPASAKWLPTGWELYSLSDSRPSGYSPSTYAARGLLSGRVTPSSPLTNAAVLGGPAPTQSITLDWIETFWPNIPVVDTVLSFARVPGAAAYWLDVYQFKNSALLQEIRASGTPSPVLPGNVRHSVVAYIADSPGTPRYKVGVPGLDAALTAPANMPGWSVLAYAEPTRGLPLLVRVTAVDAMGNVVAWTRGGSRLVQLVGTYEYVPYGALELTAGLIPRPKVGP